jgi:hypothetical protein
MVRPHGFVRTSGVGLIVVDHGDLLDKRDVADVEPQRQFYVPRDDPADWAVSDEHDRQGARTMSTRRHVASQYTHLAIGAGGDDFLDRSRRLRGNDQIVGPAPLRVQAV